MGLGLDNVTMSKPGSDCRVLICEAELRQPSGAERREGSPAFRDCDSYQWAAMVVKEQTSSTQGR